MITDHSLPYITGMGYRYKCDYKFDEFEKFDPEFINQTDGMKIFVKTDFLNDFTTNYLNKIKKKFYLYTHNSDLPVDFRYNYLLENNNLIKWYGQNICCVHPKLESIPIGLANKRWEHGNVEILEKVINKNLHKENLVYCNFDIHTNLEERTYCLQQIYPIINANKVDFENYLINLAKSYFVISPNGNGIDCHKHWESLYLKSIPIVTSSINIKFYTDYPFLVIENWSEFRNLELSTELYLKLWSKFNYKKLLM